MKTNAITLVSGQHDPVLESSILKKDAELKELAERNARHLASRNLPAKEDEDLSSYTGGIRSGYEALGAEMLGKLQPHAHGPEAKMDADYLREKDKYLEGEIKKKEDQNRNDLFDLGSFNPKTLLKRIRLVVIITIIIGFGEILFNTKAFQVTGESLLFAFLLSFSVSVAVFVFSHVASFLYKAATTKFKRRVILFSSLLLVTGLFTALAIFRTQYLATHDIHISPVFFVIINLFFFIVSALLSFYALPTWAEIRENQLRITLFRGIQKREKEIEQLKAKKEEIKVLVLENTKYRVRVSFYATYCAERIRKMYCEALDAFKSTNLMYRTDKCVPLCFSQPINEPHIESPSLSFLKPNEK